MKKTAKRLTNLSNTSIKYFREAVRTRSFYLNLAFIIFIFAIYYISTFHESYPDEYDNILGGKLILQGLLPYIGFFSHHGPVPYFLAAFLEVFTGPSFVKFRVLYSMFLAGFTLWTFYYLRHKFGSYVTKFYGYFIVLLAFSAVYFWGHMLVADSLAAFFLLPVVALLILTSINKKELNVWDIFVISILSFLALLTAITYIYVVFLIYLYTAYYCLKQNKFRILSAELVKAFLIIIAPFILFILYLLITGSLKDYFTQSIIFNQKYYIYNYPGSSGSFNPLRYGITTAYRFYINFTGLLHQIPSWNFGFPFNITLAVANTSLIIYLLANRKFTLTALLIGLLIFSNVRSNPLESGEEDYQSAVYIVISLFNMCLTLYLVYRELRDNQNFAKRVINTFILILLGLYSIFTSIFVLQKFSSKAYDKYMGNASLIYDRPEVAKYLNNVIDKGETIWYGPLEFKEMLYSTGTIPSRFHMLIPGIGRSPELSQDMVKSYEASKPRLIWFNKRYSILGQTPPDYAPFFMSFLDKNYITILELAKSGNKYTSLIPVELNRDFETMLYIRRDKVDEVLPKLIEVNIIKKSD